MAAFCPILVALVMGLLPELDRLANPPIPGEITFESETRPPFVKGKPPKKSATPTASLNPGMWEQGLAFLKKSSLNPWRSLDKYAFSEFIRQASSFDSGDQTRTRELRRQAEAWYQRLLLRYPDLAPPMRSVPDDQNGFLKWLAFSERFKKGTGIDRDVVFTYPKALEDYLSGQTPWNSAEATAWLAANRALIEEIKAIGLMPERSSADVEADRYFFIPARHVKSCADALQVEGVRLAEQGDAAGSLEAIRAARGLVDHLAEVENPTLLAATVQILVRIKLEERVLNDILPTLPAGTADLPAWEAMLSPGVRPPSELARLMTGEWSVGLRSFMLPVILNDRTPQAVPDPGAMLDHYASHFSELTRLLNAAPPNEIGQLDLGAALPDASHLSSVSKNYMESMFVGANSWGKGWERSQVTSGLTSAAFTILKGQPVPVDPISGKTYQWDASTRTLSLPYDPKYEAMDIKPLVLPKL